MEGFVYSSPSLLVDLFLNTGRGRLRTMPNPSDPTKKPFLPTTTKDDECNMFNPDNVCFLAGLCKKHDEFHGISIFNNSPLRLFTSNNVSCDKIGNVIKPPYRRWQSVRWFISLAAKLFDLTFHPLEVVSRWRDPQLQVSENYLDLTKWRSAILKSCRLTSRFFI